MFRPSTVRIGHVWRGLTAVEERAVSGETSDCADRAAWAAARSSRVAQAIHTFS
jgi:hypothetical protein